LLTDPYEKRRKVFNPIRSLKKLFGNHGSRRNLEVESGEADLVGLKAKSTTDMLQATQKVVDEETEYVT